MSLRCINVHPMPPIEVKLFHSQIKAVKKLQEHGVEMGVEDFPGRSLRVELNDKSQVYVVILDWEQVKDMHPWDFHGVLAHEACHLAVRYFEYIGEEEPGEEEMAYVTEAITSALIQQDCDWRASHGHSFR